MMPLSTRGTAREAVDAVAPRCVEVVGYTATMLRAGGVFDKIFAPSQKFAIEGKWNVEYEYSSALTSGAGARKC
ncbi:hypothetical protein [Glaciimonas immobilis]|uniref:Uncharacterized protein n=1 Tax=Glaciimonas immobilis TaxID=728004 RepID=A0A840RP75_9BURK|nr:hypothetical protein [Glaciimonas immobilis]KAF3997847.1 hypothetical protein HAV38_09645 [Glaciimonas immobilis]MBB5199515.1 hypothetical protein [Glaciimonas immobilis]